MISTPWQTASYDNHGGLRWADYGNFPGTGLGDPGGGIAQIRWRRGGPVLFWQFSLGLGLGHVLPTGGGGGLWLFEAPPDLSFLADAVNLTSGQAWCRNHDAVTARFGPAFWVKNVSGSGVDALAFAAMDADALTKNVNSIQPWSWEHDDLISANGWVECLDN